VRRGNEFAVGLAVLAALALVVGGALWLSERDIKGKYDVYVARFRTVGGLGVGAPVTLRGVRVGRVEAIRLARDAWVEAELTVEKDVTLPQRPAKPLCQWHGETHLRPIHDVARQMRLHRLLEQVLAFLPVDLPFVRERGQPFHERMVHEGLANFQGMRHSCPIDLRIDIADEVRFQIEILNQ